MKDRLHAFMDKLKNKKPNTKNSSQSIKKSVVTEASNTLTFEDKLENEDNL